MGRQDRHRHRRYRAGEAERGPGIGILAREIVGLGALTAFGGAVLFWARIVEALAIG